MPRPALSQSDINNFREEIKATGYQMISEEGVEALTLRNLARRLGCSYAKPYRYYKSKEELVDAVRGHAFGEFAKYMTTVGDKAGIPLAERYISFAIKHPEAFRIMFELKQGYTSEEAREAEARAWELCAAPFHEAARQGLLDDEPEAAAHLYWIALHGLASLALADKLNYGMDVTEITQVLIRNLPAHRFFAQENS